MAKLVAPLASLATLTGAIVVALGPTYAGLMSNDDAWCAQVLAAAALWTIDQEQPSSGTDSDSAGERSPWSAADGWRLNGYLTRTLEFESAQALFAVAVQYRPEGLRLSIGESQLAASLRPEGDDVFYLQCGAEGVRLQIEQDAGQLRIVIGSDEWRLRRREPLESSADAYVAEASLAAPMPGRVIAQLVAAGSAVRKGAPLLILEAMKMEHTLCAPANGTVRAYRAAVGEQVKEGAELIEFEATPGSPGGPPRPGSAAPGSARA